jgi:hypothetical protein
MQMDAGGRRTDIGHDGKFGTGSRVAVHEAKEHACACRLADGCSDLGYCGVLMAHSIHTLTIAEVSLFAN